MKTHLILAVGLIFVGCSGKHADQTDAVQQKPQDADQPASSTASWNPDTKKLDISARYDPNMKALDNSVKEFYELLRKKDWKDTYDLRWKRYKDLVPETLYITNAEQEVPNWQLLNYEILSITAYNSDDAILICKFDEAPGDRATYSVIDWRREKDGVWRCDAAGPRSMTVFGYLEYNKKPDEN